MKTADLVKAVSNEVGYSPGAWDMVDPIVLVETILLVSKIEAAKSDAAGFALTLALMRNGERQ